MGWTYIRIFLRSDETALIMTQHKIAPCRIRLDSVEDYEDPDDNHDVPDETDFSVIANGSASDQTLLNNPQPLTSILNSLIHQEDTLITKADVHISTSSRTSSRSSNSTNLETYKNCRTLNNASSPHFNNGCDTINSSDYVLMTKKKNNVEQKDVENQIPDPEWICSP